MCWPQRKGQRIYPVFLPGLGCPRRCIFCAQEIQTGMVAPSGKGEVLAMLAACAADLRKRGRNQPSIPQLAFYGGTFTALPESLWRICLDFASQLLSERLISGFRCSTRPDCLDRKRLQELKACGCELVELGIQSFDSVTLDCARRGYSRATAIAACKTVAAAGLGPGVQLMPGLPQSTPADFIADVEQAIASVAVCLRFYPCLVLEGSPLGSLWRKGRFAPWDLNDTIAALAQGWLLAASRHIPVIRMGLAPQPGLAGAILAGPCHPSLGSMVMGHALLLAASSLLVDKPADAPWRINLPKQAQGYRSGWRGELLEQWRKLGPSQISYWDRPELEASWD